MVVNVCIVGGGLSGSMMAILLSSKLKNYNIHLFEKRPSSSENTEPLKRSINLALSFRGGQALQQIGLYDTVMKFAIPMRYIILKLYLVSNYIKWPSDSCGQRAVNCASVW